MVGDRAHTALPWTSSELALARAFGASLIDIIVQINAVRLLIAEHQLAQIRATVGSSKEPVVIADASGRALFANDAFAALLQRPAPLASGWLDDFAGLFTDPALVGKVLATLGQERQPWRGELAPMLGSKKTLAVAVRAEVVPARDGSVLGYFMIFVDLTDTQRATEARLHLERSLSRSNDEAPNGDGMRGSTASEERGDLMSAILANASLAAMDIADGSSAPTIAPLLEELEEPTRRATALYERMRLFGA